MDPHKQLLKADHNDSTPDDGLVVNENLRQDADAMQDTGSEHSGKPQKRPTERLVRAVESQIGVASLVGASGDLQQGPEKDTKELSIWLKESDFLGFYSQREIQADQEYSTGLDETFKEEQTQRQVNNPNYDPMQTRERESNAKLMEKLIVTGIYWGRWLGDVGGPETTEFTTKTYYATGTDDKRRRIDAFTTLNLKEPIEASFGEVRTLPLGFDVTVDGSAKKIFDKLTRQYNDSAVLPFGFSHLKYYANGEAKGNLPMLPRYTIGLNGGELDGIKRELAKKEPNSFSKPMLQARFKVLSEIRAQNELYQAMLPEDAYESEDPTIQQAVNAIEVADEILHKALTICAVDIVKYSKPPEQKFYLPEKRPESKAQQTDDETKQSDGRAKQPESKTMSIAERIRAAEAMGEVGHGKYVGILQDYFIEQDRQDYLEWKRARAKKDNGIYDEKHDIDDSPFGTIMQMSKTLAKAALQETDPTLENLRGLTEKNRRVPFRDSYANKPTTI